MALVINLLVWIFLWIFAFGAFFLLRKKGVNYIRFYVVTSLLFLMFTFVSIFLFRNILFPVLKEFTIIPFTFLVLMFIIAILVYHFFNKHVKKPELLMKSNPDQYFLLMDYKYLFSKSFDILFQQTQILILVMLLFNSGFSLVKIVIIFSVLFGLVHVFNIPLAGKRFGWYYVLASFLAGILFPLLIINFDYGFVYSYILHWVFYLVSAILFWLFSSKALYLVNLRKRYGKY